MPEASLSSAIDTHAEQTKYRPLPFQVIGTTYNGETRIQHCNSIAAMQNAERRMHKYCTKVTTITISSLLTKAGESLVKGGNQHPKQRQVGTYHPISN